MVVHKRTTMLAHCNLKQNTLAFYPLCTALWWQIERRGGPFKNLFKVNQHYLINPKYIIIGTKFYANNCHFGQFFKAIWSLCCLWDNKFPRKINLLHCVWLFFTTSVTRKNRQISIKLPKNYFTKKMIDLNFFTKIA